MNPVATAQPSRRVRKKAETRSRIMAAAMDLFAIHGMDALTVDQIAEAADVGKGTVYNYFQTKDDIIVAFMLDVEREVQEEANRLARRSGSLAAILSSFLRFQMKRKEPHYAFVRVLLTQMHSRGKDFLPRLVEMQEAIDPPLIRLFSTLQDRGLVRADIRIPDLVQSFKTIHLGITSLWALEGPPWRESERLMTLTIRLLCEGMEARKQ